MNATSAEFFLFSMLATYLVASCGGLFGGIAAVWAVAAWVLLRSAWGVVRHR